MANQLLLGIASIGDLLLKNKISTMESGKTLEGILLKIPEYQRPYKWTAKNANLLLDDIENAMMDNKEVYRVGTLILHHDLREGTYNIVDGQQRTITFALLLHSLGCQKIDFLEQKVSLNSFSVHNVRNNLRSFERRIEKMKKDADDREKTRLRDYIETQCELVVVITDDLSQAFQFFDSQNARGKALYPHDLLKAYHLREMNDVGTAETEHIVRMWEDINQRELALLFNDYLYRLKEWIKGNRAWKLNEQNIDMFKGLTKKDKYPYARFYKGAFAFADSINHSQIPFVTGIQWVNPFQIDAPIIAGKPFFEYAKHYYDVLADIQNNDKYEGYLINDNEIIKTLDLRKYKNGVGNRVTRLMLDSAILLYADRFCPAIPDRNDLDYLDQFVIYAFIWAYSMRAQYRNVGWLVAQNYILGISQKEVVNSFNIYKVIAEADSPRTLLNSLTDRVMPIDDRRIQANKENPEEQDPDTKVYQNYLHFFDQYKFWRKS